MPPPAPNPKPHVDSSQSPQIYPHAFNGFEGPEKKLEIRFKPIFPAHYVSHLASSQSVTCDSFCGLRSLSRSDIRSVLDAAACNVLSMVSNPYVDAYLLSESSLFVSDMHIMIKTCGTTRLLHALPVILELAHDKLGLQIVFVQFSRVSYLFSHQQIPPHDSFEHEVVFLDAHLQTKGKIFETPYANGSRWYLYFAELSDRNVDPQVFVPSWVDFAVNTQASSESSSSQALEIYMFDLDPSAMRLFMFHDRRDCVGIDRETDGITVRTGIKTLLSDGAIVDAFNFDPCGYSMNAIVGNAYYSIHVSPEPEASYVSFETTAKIELLPQFIASVVKLFKPGRFKVALITSGDGHEFTKPLNSDIAWPLLGKLLRPQCYRQEQLMRFTEVKGCKAVVGSFYHCDGSHLYPVMSPQQLMYCPDEMKFYLDKIADSCNATFVSGGNFPANLSASEVLRLDGGHPRFLIDLGCVAANLHELCATASEKHLRLRHAVRCNTDMAILTLLSHVNVEMEVVSGSELELVQSLGVPRSRIVLATPVMTNRLRGALETVGTVVIFGRPSDELLSAVKEADVNVEICVSMTDVDELSTILSTVLDTTDKIKSIGIDFNMAGGAQSRSMAMIQSCIEGLPEYIQRDMTIHIGEILEDAQELKDGSGRGFSCAWGLSKSRRSRIGIGVDISRMVLSKSVSLMLSVIGKRDRITNLGNQTRHNYFLNDGVYGALSSVIMDSGIKKQVLTPHALYRVPKKGAEDNSTFCVADDRDEKVQCTLFGPTCDAIDRIWVGKLPTLEVGDAVLFEDMGAYSLTSASEFNGFAQRFDVGYLVGTMGGGKNLTLAVEGLC